VLLIITLASLFCSAFEVYVQATVKDYDLGAVQVESKGGLILVVACLLLLGVNLYTLKITGGWPHWTDLPWPKKAITAIPIVTGLLVIVFLCFVLLLNDLCSSDPDCY
jgi:hypothetical protein